MGQLQQRKTQISVLNWRYVILMNLHKLPFKRIKMGEGLEEKRSQEEIKLSNNAQFVKT